MKKIILAIAFISIMMFSGCGHKQGVVTTSQKSQLYFTGYTYDVEVSVDKGPRFLVYSGKDFQYAVKPGKHLVEVYRNGAIIVKREIYVGDGITKEIEVR